MKEENIYWAPTLKVYDFTESLLQASVITVIKSSDTVLSLLILY